MATYIGFSTVGANQPRELDRPGRFGGPGSTTYEPRLGRKYVLTDEQLVIRDLLNALSIKQGDKVGQPQYGTTLWTYVFEPQTEATQQLITTEVRRVMNLDPRIILNSLGVYAQNNGILLQVEMAFSPFNNVLSTSFFLNKYDGSIRQLAQ
jgi:phage baseplate assembly protein W